MVLENGFVVKQARELCILYFFLFFFILYFLRGNIHITCLSKYYKKCFILSNPIYLRPHYRTPIPNTYYRCDSTLVDVAITKKDSFKDGNVSIMTGVWQRKQLIMHPTNCFKKIF